ncbi:MAG: hypothetical protein P9L99_21600 [Candidatus Lernaella stagnicola]|nr:hypothetical protein [Candidatus Lernaella stagnicola]
MTKWRPGAIVVLVLLAACLIGGCQGGDADTAETTSVVKAYMGAKADLPPSVTQIELTVTGDDMHTIVKILSLNDFGELEDVFFEVKVSPGIRLFTVMCRDAGSFSLYRGQRQVRIDPKETVDLEINLAAWAAVGGRVTYPDGSLLSDYDEMAFDPEIATNDLGLYEVESRLTTLTLRLQPAADAYAFAEVDLVEAGQQTVTNLVLIDPTDSSRPWISAAVPHTDLAAGQQISLFGQGFTVGDAFTVWFGAPGDGAAAAIVDVATDSRLQVTVPTDVPVQGLLFVCWTNDEECSNGFGFN